MPAGNKTIKTLQHNTEAERALLGSMFMDSGCIINVSDIVSGKDFYNGLNGVLFDSMTELNRRGLPVDTVMLSEIMKEK